MWPKNGRSYVWYLELIWKSLLYKMFYMVVSQNRGGIFSYQCDETLKCDLCMYQKDSSTCDGTFGVPLGDNNVLGFPGPDKTRLKTGL